MPGPPQQNYAAAGADPGTATQLSQQVQTGRDLHDQNIAMLDQLKVQLANGQISENDYWKQVAEAHQSELELLREQLLAQDRPEAAAAIPGPEGGTGGEGVSASPNPFTPSAQFAPEGVQFSDPSLHQPQQLSEDEMLLAGPTDRPNESQFTSTPRQLPQNVLDAIPILVEAAKDPNASPAVRALMRILDYYTRGA